MAGPGNILIKVGADAGQAVRELSTVDKALGDTMSSSEKMGAGLKKAALPAAAALGAIAIASVGAAKAAAEDASEQEHLAGVLRRVTGATDAQVASLEDWIGGLSEATGVTDSELRPSLEKIVTATGDVTKSQALMKQALDISAASGKDVETVSTAIAKAYTGSTASLEKLIPGLSEAAKESDDFNVIMAELAKTTGGAMAESAGTAEGQMKILNNQMGELEEELGSALLPVMRVLLPLMRSLASFASDNAGAIQVLVGVIAGLSAAILVANAAMKAYAAAQAIVKAATAAWTAAQWLLNAALTANPLGLVIVAVAALGAALVLAYQRSETFRNVVDRAMDVVRSSVAALGAAFNSLRNAAFLAWDWVVDHWKVALFAFGPVGAAVYAIATNFDAIKRAADAAYDFVKKTWTIASFAFGPIESAVRGIASAFDAIASAVRGAVDAVQDLIGWLGRIKIPKLPSLGDLIPGRGRSIIPAGAGAGPRAAGLAAPAGTAGLTINVYGAIDPEGTARSIRRVLASHDRRQGRRP